MTVLLLGADYYGTLAAARAFGRAGIRVVMADSNRRARGLYSKYVAEKLIHPPEPEALIDWLVAWGERNPGTVLYPPNDHLAWLFAMEQGRLSRVFSMFSPSSDAIITLLDKKRLHDACDAVGIDVPVTRGLADLGLESTAVRSIPFPILLKPRMQVYLTSGIKGFIAHDHVELASELARFNSLVSFDPVITRHYPDIAEPMLQEYLAAAETSIFSVSGFVGAGGEIVARGAMKVLQRPRKVGIGLCFESRPVDQPLVDKLGALSAKVGYFGAFESEFIVHGNRRLLIDFNPRFYSQMGFDIARGLPIPTLVWHSARGDHAQVNAEIARARAYVSRGDEVYCHKTMLDLVLGLQGFSGQMSHEEVTRWRSWYAAHRSVATDAVRDPEDRVPGWIDAAQWLGHFARHPRSFVRSFVLNR